MNCITDARKKHSLGFGSRRSKAGSFRIEHYAFFQLVAENARGLILGKSPFATDDAEVTYQRILDNEYDFPGDIDISKDARDLIGRLLRTDPSDR